MRPMSSGTMETRRGRGAASKINLSRRKRNRCENTTPVYWPRQTPHCACRTRSDTESWTPSSTRSCVLPPDRQAKAERHAARHIAHGPDLTGVYFDDRSADGQSHAHPRFLRGEKWLKDLVKVHSSGTAIF